MTEKRKKLARALSKKTGMSYQAAINTLSRSRSSGSRTPIVQVIHSFRNEHGVTFSEQCSNCGRWIWCGSVEHEATCFCGQPYHIAFDAEPNWGMKQGMCCMDCGAPYQLAQPREGRSPWHVVNPWQNRCHTCATGHDTQRVST